MRLLMKLMLAAGMVFAFSSQASAVAVDLVQIGGPATPSPSDVIVFNIQVTLQGGEGVTAVDPAIEMMGASYVGGTEQPFNFVNGVLLTPIGAAGADLGTINGGLAVAGWEATTLTAGGAPGPAVFNIGSVQFHVGSPNVWLTFDTPGALGVAFGTVVGDGGFNNISTQVSWGNYHLVPEPTTAGLMTLGLIGLVVAGRRR
jgi:hypothetical protein